MEQFKVTFISNTRNIDSDGVTRIRPTLRTVVIDARSANVARNKVTRSYSRVEVIRVKEAI